MKIENEIFYHLQKKHSKTDEWKVGNVLEWNSRLNSFSNCINSMDLRIPVKGEKKPYRQAYIETFKGKIDLNNPELTNFFNFTNFALNKTSIMLRELVLEKYRIENFPNLPNRANCIWVCKKETLDYWKKSLQINEFDILKLNLTGEIHISTDRTLYSDVLNIEQYWSLAEKYWIQNQNWEYDSEGIFDGKIEVLSRN